MSFAWAWFASAVATGILSVLLSPNLWIFRPLFGSWGDMLRFGGYSGATSLLYRANDSLPYLLLGRFLSFDGAALFSRAVMICQLPSRLVLGGAISVALPAFSNEARHGRSLKRAYLAAIALITVLQWPALLVVSVLASPIVTLLLGAQWGEVADLVPIIAVGYLFSFGLELTDPLLISVGAVRHVLTRALIVCPATAIAVAVGAMFGLKAVAWSLLLVVPFQALVSHAFIHHHLDVSWREVGEAVWRSGVAALASIVGPLAVVFWSGKGFDLPLPMAIGAGALAVVGWGWALWYTGHDLLDELAKVPLIARRAGAGRAA